MTFGYHELDKKKMVERILELHSQRVKIRDMAEELGINHNTVHNWLKEGLRLAELPDPGEALKRDLILADSAIRALIPDVLLGKPAAHAALIRWLDRRSKYLGLDVPEKLDAIITHQHVGSIDDEVRELEIRLGVNDPVREEL